MNSSVTSTDENADGPFQPETVIQPALAVQDMSVGEDTVLFDALRNRAYRLSPAAGDVWRFVQHRPDASYEQLVDHLVTAHDLDRHDAASAASSFLTELLARGLIGTT
ncbi:PqqD family protein [Gandjariella thermophila]|uniref:PqqD family protein n=1 Tax=Gandjariella thermophila TaxID=1931992 RepID=A0A4D4J7R7_9PSEU|nr:PqqD family protein [Gandjariella thermophila]GDY30549.1 hypothetical protein GTS_21820 [Gandjariella thermophila]